jgi:hypothetical protein
VAEVQAGWRERLGKVRANSAADILVGALPGAPVITVKSAAALIGRSEQAVYEAIPRLVEAGVLQQTTIRRRNRAFEAADLIEAFTDLHRAQVPVPPYLTVSVPSIPPCRCPGTEQ